MSIPRSDLTQREATALPYAGRGYAVLLLDELVAGPGEGCGHEWRKETPVRGVRA